MSISHEDHPEVSEGLRFDFLLLLLFLQFSVSNKGHIMVFALQNCGFGLLEIYFLCKTS